MPLLIRSSAFADHGTIPRIYSCEGADISPPLHWSGAPQGTKSFALIIDDPDAPDPKAPRMTWVHWVVYDLPADTQGLSEGAATQGLPAPARQGINDWKRASYGGPCPPIGQHRYFHKLYALDAVLSDLEQPTKAQLMASMKGHVLAEAQLVGTFEKTG